MLCQCRVYRRIRNFFWNWTNFEWSSQPLGPGVVIRLWFRNGNSFFKIPIEHSTINRVLRCAAKNLGTAWAGRRLFALMSLTRGGISHRRVDMRSPPTGFHPYHRRVITYPLPMWPTVSISEGAGCRENFLDFSPKRRRIDSFARTPIKHLGYVCYPYWQRKSHPLTEHRCEWAYHLWPLLHGGNQLCWRIQL